MEKLKNDSAFNGWIRVEISPNSNGYKILHLDSETHKIA